MVLFANAVNTVSTSSTLGKQGSLAPLEVVPQVSSQTTSRKPCAYIVKQGYTIEQPLMQTSKLWSLLKDAKRKDEPALMTNHFVAKTKMQGFKLSEGGSKIMNLPNAGGSSEASEVMSFELLADMFNAKLLFTEMELNYGPGSKITDFSVQIQGETVGVSVTRAMKFRGTFTLEDATKLLEKKMMGVIMSTQGVSRSQRWGRQILHVWVEKPYMADLIVQAYEQLSDEIKNNTVVMVTTVSNAEWLFYAY